MTSGSRFHRRIGLHIAGARLALAWERFWPGLWPAPLVVGLFLVVAFLDVLPRLDGWLHLLVLIGFGGALVLSLWQARGAFSWPSRFAGQHRLERASGLSHRPLVALADRPAVGAGDPDAEALWAVHRQRMAARLKDLRIGTPKGGLAARDRFALRALVALLLILAVSAAGDRSATRLAQALSPNFSATQLAAPATLDIWITPPSYTGLAPIYVKHQSVVETRLSFPVGSTILAQLNGGSGIPTLIVDENSTPFTALEDGAFKVSAGVEYGHHMAVVQDGKEIGAWDLDLVPDQPPAVTIPRAPRATLRLALRIDYDAEDDYGLSGIVAELRQFTAAGPGNEVLELDIPVSARRPRTALGASFHDLTAHIWAGLEVELRLVASDGLGQSGTSKAVRIKLPAREFNHPIARAIIEQRRMLTEAPEKWRDVARSLAGIASMHTLYDEDTVVYLALTMSRSRLIHGHGVEGLDEIRDLLWDTALRVEDGKVPLAERALRSAMQRLLEALANDASEADIERLLQQLQAAIQNYMDSLAAQAEDDPDLDAFTNNAMKLLQRQDLQRILDQIRELSRAGARDAARQLLSQLQAMLENLRQGRMAQMSPSQSREAMKMMRELRDLIGRQQRLLDRTFQSARRQNQPGTNRPQSGRQGDMPEAGEQDRLRRALGEFMRRMGEQLGTIPRPFGRAERAMRDAVDALSRRSAKDAVPAESEALDQLQQGARAMAQSLARQLGLFGQINPNLDEQGRPRTDPLGRQPPGIGGLDSSTVRIPEEADLQRARDIRDELRRRSGDRDRPFLERDYIDRLLKRF